MNILHLSDLHFGTQDDARIWAGQLAEDLSGGLNRRRLDALIISGDVGTRSEPEEYAAAKGFLDAVCGEFRLGPEGIVLAPGNHDLNWKLAKKGYSLVEREDYEGDLSQIRHVEVGDGVIRVRNKEDAYWRRFSHFNDFHKAVKGTPYPLEPSCQGVLHHLPDHNLLILALNSCWDIDQRFPSAAGIHPHTVGYALDDIRRNANRYGDCLKFAVWRHPLDSPSEDRITDRGFIARLANSGFRAAFHGHIHKAEKGLFAYTERYWTEEGRKWLAHTGAEYPRFWRDRKWNCPNFPVVGVCWYEARAFTTWLTEAGEGGYSYFLPDENQWEAAAAGFEGRKYPWGDEWAKDCCNSKEAGLEMTSPVGIFGKGNIIDEGFCDLGGILRFKLRSRKLSPIIAQQEESIMV